MNRSLKIQMVMIAVITLVPQYILAHKLMELSPELLREDYPEAPERNVISNGRNFHSNQLHIFSEDGSQLFDKSHPRFENMEENKMAIELKKRISRLIDDPERRRIDYPDSKLNKLFLSNWEVLSNGGRYRRPLVMKSYVDGSYKLSHPPGKKRPYYYSEPEGSEFLGGPGK
ncbi:uncharacterized protein CEXT_513581 [Caerostris extrusa]|uniref:Uncharacterized protein n=1 Tax=Caerostris extrusa TaxID=172846 RepID=A0AAV4YCE4_CAEEX|nr:uncharacterized protein CEXT_513581 [Caerostris extrusa]